MPAATIGIVANILGQTVPVSIGRTNDGAGFWDPALAAGLPSLTWTKATDTTGTITLSAGHGLVTNDLVDVFWDGGRRYGVTATVTVNSVALATGAGDNFPATATAVVIQKQTEVSAAFDPDDVDVLMVTTTRRLSLEFLDAGGAVLLALDLAAGECCLWWASSGITRPMTGNAVAKIRLGNGDTAAAAVTVSVIYDATP